jgi:hypothetical protein
LEGDILTDKNTLVGKIAGYLMNKIYKDENK